MAETSQAHKDDSERTTNREEPIATGWDRNAFWYPTLDRRGGLLFLFVVLFGMHFNELFGLHVSETLIAGWIPANLAYYLLMGLLHLGFMVLLYYSWPFPRNLDRDEHAGTTSQPAAED